MSYRMMHPRHGWMVAADTGEVEYLQSKGWKPDDGKALAEKIAAAEDYKAAHADDAIDALEKQIADLKALQAKKGLKIVPAAVEAPVKKKKAA